MSGSKAREVVDTLLDRHPAQRLHSPSRGLSAALHATGITSFALSFKFLKDNPNVISESYGWHFQYLTIIGLLFATATFTLGLLADVTLSKNLFFAKNALTVASAPMEVLISFLYWGLGLVDPSLVRADFLPPLPKSADIGMHAMPAILLIVDIFFFSPPWSISALPSICLSSGIAIAYWFWIEHCYSINGFYPYPIFDVERPLRISLFVASALVQALSTLTLKAFYHRFNSKTGTKKAD